MASITLRLRAKHEDMLPFNPQGCHRGGMFYCVDKTTGKRTSLQSINADEARQIIEAKNQAERQTGLNLQIAKAYGSHSDRFVPKPCPLLEEAWPEISGPRWSNFNPSKIPGKILQDFRVGVTPKNCPPGTPPKNAPQGCAKN